MHPILIIVLATAAGVPLGLWLRHNLAKLSYRNADEADLPDPGQRWWVVWTSVLVIGSLATAVAVSPNPLVFLPLIPLAATGPWLAAVDFDVLRVPNRALVPTAIASLLIVVGLAAAAQDWLKLFVPVAAALLAGGVFAALHFATRGGIGFGDVKLATAIGLVVGPLGIGAIWLSVLTGSVGALIWAKASRRVGPIPYAPSLLCGVWIAALSGLALVQPSLA